MPPSRPASPPSPTRILAIEASGRVGSLAVLEGTAGDARLLQEVPLASQQRTAQILAPTLKELLQNVGWPPGSIELVAVTVGPGSFTGLRIGVTTAKTFAYAANSAVLGVNTLAVLAAQVPQRSGPVWAVLDAQRQELFAAKFAGDCPLFSPTAVAAPTDANREKETVPLSARTVETHILPQSEWLTSLHPGDLVTGPALAKLQPRLPAGVEVADESRWQPTAGTVGRLAWRDFQIGRRDDLWELLPEYYRLSAAEEKKTKGHGDGETKRQL